jgi:hypothetical protein
MSLRAIRVEGEVVPRDAGPRPVLVWLPVRHLVIDEAYQRPLGNGNWRKIRAIAKAFDWARFSPVLVAPVDPAEGDGLFAVIDGQHRAHAALLAGQAEVPALIVTADRAQQAAGFVAVNAQAMAVTSLIVYRAALAAGEAQALAMDACVAAAGGRLMTANASTRHKKAGEVYAVALIRDHVAAGRAGVVTAGLAALRQSRVGQDPVLWGNTFLAPWLGALAGQPDAARRDDLAGFLDSADWARVMTGAAKLRAQPAYAGKSQQVIVTQLMAAMLIRWADRGQVAA